MMSKTNKNNFLLDLSNLGLEVGESTYKTPCPQCNQSGSFSVTRNEFGYLYNCFRDSCGIKGFVESVINSNLVKSRRVEKKEDFVYPSVDLEKIDVSEKELWSFVERDSNNCIEYLIPYGAKYDTISERIYFPTTSGFTLRRVYGKQTPKSLNYRTKEGLNVFKVIGKDINKFFLVEDIYSAIKLHMAGYTAIALLGTHLPKEFKAWGPIPYYVWLDKDAIQSAVKISNHLNMMADGFGGVIYTDHDPKFYCTKEIHTIVKEFCGT